MSRDLVNEVLYALPEAEPHIENAIRSKNRNLTKKVFIGQIVVRKLTNNVYVVVDNLYYYGGSICSIYLFNRHGRRMQFSDTQVVDGAKNWQAMLRLR